MDVVQLLAAVFDASCETCLCQPVVTDIGAQENLRAEMADAALTVCHSIILCQAVVKRRAKFKYPSQWITTALAAGDC